MACLKGENYVKKKKQTKTGEGVLELALSFPSGIGYLWSLTTKNIFSGRPPQHFAILTLFATTTLVAISREPQHQIRLSTPFVTLSSTETNLARMVAQGLNPSCSATKAGDVQAQGQPELQREFKGSLVS